MTTFANAAIFRCTDCAAGELCCAAKFVLDCHKRCQLRPSQPPNVLLSCPNENAVRVQVVRETLGQAGRYLIGGFIALAVDIGVVTLGMQVRLPILVARVVGLLAGVTTTYFFNRRYTFSPQHKASFQDWGQYLLQQLMGTALNFAVSSGLIYLSDRVWWQIWGAILAGAAAGFCVNFFSARRQLHR